jgi:molybdate/tungstate transport system substrate-binding protein
MNLKRIFFLLMICSIGITGCNSNQAGKKSDVIIFHAGSLSVPLKQIADDYEKKNPKVRILLEPAGSLVCARKITELKKPCDIIASADYFVINELLIPEYATWSVRFATNEIVIAFQEKSNFSAEIDSTNWMDILLRKDVTYARSDPDSDPCGYRSVFTFKLAEKYYRRPGLADRLVSKNREFIRPKEVDLVALIESNAVDYMFQYKSVAIQHNLKYIELPEDINLGDPGGNAIYNTVSLDVTGSSPGSRMNVKGEYINYSLTVLSDAPHQSEAIDFTAFMLGRKEMEVFIKYGHKPIIPFSTGEPSKLPASLKELLDLYKSELSGNDQK